MNQSCGCVEHKNDPFGRDKPSELPPHGSTNRQKPQLTPPGTPIYLKPTRINTRDVEIALMNHLKLNQPALAHDLLSEWRQQQELLTREAIQNAVQNGDFNEDIYSKIHKRHVHLVNTHFDRTWRNTAYVGARLVAEDTARYYAKMPGFDEFKDDLNNAIDTSATESIKNLDDQTRKAFKNTIRRQVVDAGAGVTGLTERLKPLVGLTNNMAIAVDRFAASIALDNTPLQTAKLRQQYAERLLKNRARRIARTEIAKAYNTGQQHQMLQGIEDGDISDPVVKRFYTSLDERVCPICGPLHGHVVGVDGTFPSTNIGPDGQQNASVLMPPLHPQCRCTILWEFLDVEQTPIEQSPGVFISAGSGEAIPNTFAETGFRRQFDDGLEDDVRPIGAGIIRFEAPLAGDANTVPPLNEELEQFRAQPDQAQVDEMYARNVPLSVVGVDQAEALRLLLHVRTLGLDEYLVKNRIGTTVIARSIEEDEIAGKIATRSGSPNPPHEGLLGFSTYSPKLGDVIAVKYEPGEARLKKKFGTQAARTLAETAQDRVASTRLTLIHELGHVIDRQQDLAKDIAKEFKKVTASIAERRTNRPEIESVFGFVSLRHSMGASEWFAESVVAYFEYKERFRRFEGGTHFDSTERLLKKAGVLK